MRLLNAKREATVWPTSWSDYHGGLQRVDETFIFLISPFLPHRYTRHCCRREDTKLKIQTLPVIGYDFSFVVWETENRHTDQWLMDKDQRETTQQQQDQLQVIRSNEDRRTRSDEGWGAVLYYRGTLLDHQLCGSPSFIGNGAQSGDAQLNFNTRWNWWLCEWASFQR